MGCRVSTSSEKHFMRLSPLRGLASVTLSILCSNAALAAVPMPVVMNDGYLIVDDLAPYASAGKASGLTPRLCPPGAISGTLVSGDVGCQNNGKEVRVVTPQQALDLAYGPNVAVAVGVAPLVAPKGGVINGFGPPDRLQTVIYFRRAN